MKDGLRQSQKEQAELHDKELEKLNARYTKLQNRIREIYLDKLDGEIEDVFYQQNVSQWREEQVKIRDSIEHHEKADQNYIEQGIKLLELAQNAQNIFRNRDENARTELLRFIMPDSLLEKDTIRRGAALTESERLILLRGVGSNFYRISPRRP